MVLLVSLDRTSSLPVPPKLFPPGPKRKSGAWDGQEEKEGEAVNEIKLAHLSVICFQTDCVEFQVRVPIILRPSTVVLILLETEIRLQLSRSQMAFADIDLKLLGRFARSMQVDHPLLSQSLFQILGLLTMLSARINRARSLKELGHTREAKSLELYQRVLWYAREGLKILEEYVFPIVVNFRELKVLAYKLRASFYHIYVLFHNHPPIHLESKVPPELDSIPEENDKEIDHLSSPSQFSDSTLKQPTNVPEGCVKVEPSLSNGPHEDVNSNFILVTDEYRPITLHYFREAMALAEFMLGGSHPLRLSIKAEFAAFLYDCLYDREGSRRLAAETIREVYNAPEEMEDETFEDSIQLVMILGKMSMPEVVQGDLSKLQLRVTSTLTQNNTMVNNPENEN